MNLKIVVESAIFCRITHILGTCRKRCRWRLCRGTLWRNWRSSQSRELWRLASRVILLEMSPGIRIHTLLLYLSPQRFDFGCDLSHAFKLLVSAMWKVNAYYNMYLIIVARLLPISASKLTYNLLSLRLCESVKDASVRIVKMVCRLQFVGGSECWKNWILGTSSPLN